MTKVGKAKKGDALGKAGNSMEVTRHSIKVTGKRPILGALAVAFALGVIYILMREGKPNVNVSVYGNDGVAIGQARTVTVNHGAKEDK